jgi:sugar/nucleoside kinase (ribokinase family)
LLLADGRFIVVGMSNRKELATLKNLLSEADLILSTTKLPENRTARCRELLASALALTDDLLSQSKASVAAITLGRKGGSVTAKRGSDYFRRLAARRKTHGGGRPRKESE